MMVIHSPRFDLKFSIDTVRFVVPVSDEIFSRCDEFFPLSSEKNTYSLDGSLQFSCKRFRLYGEEELDGRSSYCNDVAFVPVRFGSAFLPGLLFEFSVPKFLWGHNLFLCWNLDVFMDSFEEFLRGKFRVAPWRDWVLRRIDLSYNFWIGGMDDVEEVLRYCARLRFRGKESFGRKFAYWSFQNRTIKMYSKFEEMGEHRGYYDSKFFDVVRFNSVGVIRFEEEWRQAYLMRRAGVSKVECMTFGRFLSYMRENYSWGEHVKELFKDMDGKVIDMAGMIDLVESRFRKSSGYVKFLLECHSLGVDEVKKRYKKATFYDLKKKLSEIGIDVCALDDRVKKPISLNADNLVNGNSAEAEFMQEMVRKYGAEKVEKMRMIGSPGWMAMRQASILLERHNGFLGEFDGDWFDIEEEDVPGVCKLYAC